MIFSVNKKSNQRRGRAIAVCLTIACCAAGCMLGSYATKPLNYDEIVLDYDRSDFGNAPFSFWMHLTPFEIRTLLDAEKAKAGDPDALLALALVASGNVRDSAHYIKYQSRISRFIAKIRAGIDAEKDVWQKGFKLYQFMRKEFLTKDSVKELTGYDWYRSRLSDVLENGTYNCISSALLYIICARYFNMRVQGVLLPTHAFVQLPIGTNRIIEIETTSKLGYDWIHDEQYYKTRSAGWFSARGLAAQNHAEYLKRVIMEPYQLICHNMTNQHTAVNRMNIKDIHRLKEIQAFVETASAAYQRERLAIYQVDFAYLQENNDYRTAEKLFLRVNPVIEATQRTFPNDTSIINLAARLCCNENGVLFHLNKREAFLASTKKTLALLPRVTAYSNDLKNNCLSNAYNCMKRYVDRNQFDTVKLFFDLIAPYAGSTPWLNQNIQWALGTEMHYYWAREQWQEVIRICKRQLSLSPDSQNRAIAESNMEGAYCNWSNIYLKEGNWPKAREILKQCEKDSLSQQKCCAPSLKELEATHRF